MIKGQRDVSSAEINGLLFAADRLKQFNEVVKPALEKHKMVVMDRSVFSSFAYQSAQGASLEWLETINKHTPLPGLAIVLDTPPEVGLKRVEERGEISNFDKMFNKKVLQEKVRFAYHLLAEKYADRIIVIEVMDESIREVRTLIRKVVSARLEPHPTFAHWLLHPTEKRLKKRPI